MGKLYLIPTPIGNLDDMTFRSIKVLNEVDAILCEDTRTSSRLLNHYNIQKKLIPHHQHNEHKAVEKVIEHLQNGENLALISDAGTPGISDPGFLLVRACVAAEIEVETLPEATAFVPALVNSGFPSDRFCFEGFLPHKKGRHSRLTQLKEEERTIIFYESTHRIVKSLLQMTEYFGEDRKVSVSRELTKMHEETVRGTLVELAQYYTDHVSKGEFVVVVEGKK